MEGRVVGGKARGKKTGKELKKDNERLQGKEAKRAGEHKEAKLLTLSCAKEIDI